MSNTHQNDALRCELDPGTGIATLTLAMPKVNVINDSFGEGLADALAWAKGREGLKGIIITSAHKDFCAGADLDKIYAARDAAEVFAAVTALNQLFRAIETAGVPVVAALNGTALGGGYELAMACHIRYAAAGARMGQPEINLGIIPGFGGSQRLPRLIGKGRALEMLLGGDPVDAARALELGLVDRVLPDAELFDAAFALAAKLAGKAPVARRLILDAVVRGLDVNLDDGLRLEADLFGVVGATEDVKEGLTAFLDKRAATFRGK